jgi:hypothetical protein
MRRNALKQDSTLWQGRNMLVNAERGRAYGSSPFEVSKNLESSVDGIGETLRAGNFALT